jgi:hypothetical protein
VEPSIPHLKCGAVILTLGLAFFFPPSKLGELSPSLSHRFEQSSGLIIGGRLGGEIGGLGSPEICISRFHPNSLEKRTACHSPLFRLMPIPNMDVPDSS